MTVTPPNLSGQGNGSNLRIALVLDQWISADFAESSEARRFYSAYASKMGIDIANSQDASERAKTLFGQYQGVWKEVASKMQGIKGYPVRAPSRSESACPMQEFRFAAIATESSQRWFAKPQRHCRRSGRQTRRSVPTQEGFADTAPAPAVETVALPRAT